MVFHCVRARPVRIQDTMLDPTAKRILALFDEMNRETLDLHTMLELAGGNRPPEREAVLDSVTNLVQQGWLRATGSDYYARTEDGRLQLAGPRDVTMYTRRDCHLCEEAKKQIAPLLREFRAKLREVDIDQDPILRERYNNDVPVIFLGARKVAKHRVDVEQLRRQLAQTENAKA